MDDSVHLVDTSSKNVALQIGHRGFPLFKFRLACRVYGVPAFHDVGCLQAIHEKLEAGAGVLIGMAFFRARARSVGTQADTLE